MLRKKTFLAIFLFIIFIIGCAPQPATATPNVLETIVAGTLTALTIEPPTVAIEPTSTLESVFTPIGVTTTPTSASVGEKYINTTVENLNLRVGPGRLFQVSRVLAKETQLELLGVAPGNRWVQVRNSEGIIGWVGDLFIEGIFDGTSLLIVAPTDAVTITGFVTNDNGPITYLGLALVQGQGDQFDEGFTDDTGKYYIYVPKTLTGEWFLQEYGTDCRSNTRDANCQCLSNPCGSLSPTFYRLTFPLANTFYRFGWQ